MEEPWYNSAMRAELLTIGAELVSGATVNTNAAYLARRLAEIGLPCQRQVAISDERAALLAALREVLHRCDVLITTGGLGPTFDDLTMEAIAEATHRPLRYRADAAATIRRFYSRRHRRLQRAALRQALLPEGGRLLPNPLGTAPGLWLQLPECLLIAVPGVPAEMRTIMEHDVLPRLRRLPGLQAVVTRTLRTVGVVELEIERCLRRLRVPEAVQIGLYPHLRAVDVRLTATLPSPRAAAQALRQVEASLLKTLGLAIYGTGEETLEAVVGALLVKQRKTLAVAESCTGGLVSDRITNVSGSSRYLRGSFIAYHNDLKRRLLGVSAATLARNGAVSAPVSRAMAQGVRRMAGSDVGLAVTGIAGPTGATAKKPVGLVFLGLADRGGARSLRCQFFGDRASIKMQAAQTALDFLRRYLYGLPSGASGTSASTVYRGPVELKTL
jgi:nicotinamide-nucleotide amidase